MSIEAMKQARKVLRDLTTIRKGCDCPICHADELLRLAIKKAEKQEPVAYPEGDVAGPCICGSWPGGKCLKCPRIEPPKREWVGLTDEDKQEAFDETQEASGGFWEFAEYLEVKLKEKNT